MKKALSVIIPVYNVESYIKECLDSIVNQSIGIENIEVIIVNDKTPDNSMDIVMKYADKYPSFKVINNEVNMGLGESRNIGLKHVTSDYVTFLDSDDFISLNAYEDALNKINENNVDLLIYRWETYSMGEIVQTNNIHHQFLEENILIDDINNYPKLFFLTSAWNKIYHKSLFHLLKYSKGLYEDNCVTCNVLLNAKRIFLSNDSIYYYRKNLDSITEKISKNNVIDLCNVISQLYDLNNHNVNILIINFINDVLFWIYYYDWVICDELTFVEKLQKVSKKIKQSDVEKFVFLFPEWNFYKEDILNLDNYDSETFLAKYKYYKRLPKVKSIAGLYVDEGNGFSEDCRIDVVYVPKLKNNQLTFDLRGYSNISGIRFDPLEGEFIKSRINNIKVIDANCDNSINDDYQYFLTLDPNFVLDGEFKDDKLMIDFDLEFITNEELASLFVEKNAIIAEKNNIINEINHKDKKHRFNFFK
ncbi:glycosyltransferase family 2 protein [Methanobrevibacter sp.]|uniref:glycosyltransferase family 2 protein n=1 Tax=Methanobrevibacter sp. TaxID=66852 RepID=UPI00388F5B2D